MNTQEPTQEQRKKFWECCGLFEVPKYGGSDYSETLWQYPDRSHHDKLPPIDLNNLFQYAIPKAIDKIMSEQACSSDLAYAILFKKWLYKLEIDIPNHEGTLFWTIYAVMEEDYEHQKAET
jgi:hypothetical protein